MMQNVKDKAKLAKAGVFSVMGKVLFKSKLVRAAIKPIHTCQDAPHGFKVRGLPICIWRYPFILFWLPFSFSKRKKVLARLIYRSEEPTVYLRFGGIVDSMSFFQWCPEEYIKEGNEELNRSLCYYRHKEPCDANFIATPDGEIRINKR